MFGNWSLKGFKKKGVYKKKTSPPEHHHCLCLSVCFMMSNHVSFLNKVVTYSMMPLESQLLGEWAHSSGSACTHLLPQAHPSPMGDIFNLIKACQHIDFGTFNYGPAIYGLHGLWIYWSVMRGALSVQDHMDEEPLCLPYGPALSAGDTDTWLVLRFHSPPATHN